MQNVFTQADQYINFICQAYVALSILATLIIRIIPGEKDDKYVNEAMIKFQKIISYLPTLGINPRTKKLEEALKDIQDQEK